METIKNYLENMFSSFPHTAEVLKMKQDLLMTMEDKYHGLKALGKSENEAIGVVISEFGNIEELAVDLGINPHFKQDDRPLLTADDAAAYLESNKENAEKTAFGVSLCIFGPCLLMISLFLFNFSPAGIAIGLGCLMTFTGTAVGVFITQDARMEKYNHFTKREYLLTDAAKTFVEAKKKAFSQRHTVLIVTGVLLCVFSPLLVILPAILLPHYILPGVSAMLFVVTAAVYPLAFSDIINDGHKALLSKAN